MNNVLFSHNSDEWETPQTIYNELNSEFSFDLDPCATANNAKCEHFFTISEDGLTKQWSGHTVFCNPPYSRVSEWVKKSYEEAKKGATVVLLLPSRTDTRWFHDYVYGKAEVRFIRGRLRFGESKGSAPFPSMVVVFQRCGERKEDG